MWWELAVSVLVAIGVVAVPGAIAVLAVGLRGRWMLGLAIPAGVTVVSLAALLGGALGVPWSLTPVVISLLALLVVIVALRLILWRRAGIILSDDGAQRPHFYALLATAIIVIVVQFLLVIGSPDNISQTFDNIFHLNAVQYVLDTDNASPLAVGRMANPSGALGFYPSGWHAVTSLVVQLAGTTIPVASNAVMILFGAVAWPASIFLLTSTFARISNAALVGLFAATVGISAFPMLLIDYGVLFPFMASLSLVPAAVALVVVASSSSSSKVPSTALSVTFLGLIPGIMITHPGGFVALLAVISVVLGAAFIRAMRSPDKSRALLVTFAVIFAGIVATAWYVLRPDAAARTWGPEMTIAQAMGEVAFASVNLASINFVIAALVGAGVVALLRRRSHTDIILLVVFGVLALLYIVAAALPFWTPRDVLVGAWYNNIPRLAALLPLAWVPLSAIGADFLWKVWARRHEAMTGKSVTRLGVALTVILVVGVPQVTQMYPAIIHAHGLFQYTDESPLLTADERELISRLPDEVPLDTPIAGSSWTGVGLTYALTGIPVLMPHTLMEVSPDLHLINEELDEATPGSAVCAAVDRLNVEYVLDFGDQEINESSNPMPGFDQLATSSAVTLVDEQGDAKLYRIVACG